MFEAKDRQLAKQLVENKDMLEFILKVLDTPDTLTDEFYKNKDNQELGEFVRAQWLARQMVISRYAKIKQLAQDVSTSKTQTVPA